MNHISLPRAGFYIRGKVYLAIWVGFVKGDCSYRNRNEEKEQEKWKEKRVVMLCKFLRYRSWYG